MIDMFRSIWIWGAENWSAVLASVLAAGVVTFVPIVRRNIWKGLKYSFHIFRTICLLPQLFPQIAHTRARQYLMRGIRPESLEWWLGFAVSKEKGLAFCPNCIAQWDTLIPMAPLFPDEKKSRLRHLRCPKCSNVIDIHWQDEARVMSLLSLSKEERKVGEGGKS